ncbi:unnamed protein product [Ilex paraguariensis]|uniref:Topoisomerase 6 subunit A/Spo11 TOPRIM domain-containing protein n=1 Tax=Ilex paraguariensis TaxID=185542 RepID=A0ABC8RV53_9AQUA
MAYDAEFLRVPGIRWIGAFPQDCERYHLPQQCLLPLTAEDKTRIEAMLHRCYLQREVSHWRLELELLLQRGVKFEIEALSVHSISFLSEEYVPSKIQGLSFESGCPLPGLQDEDVGSAGFNLCWSYFEVADLEINPKVLPLNILGVYSVTIDAQAGTAKVSGEVDPNLLLRALARSGRHAELIWVKLNHPVLNSSNYDNGYSPYGSYEPYNYGANGSYGYGAIDEPYRYRRALQEHSYYDTHQQYYYYPMRRAVWEYPTSSTTIRYGYGYGSPQRARYVPGYPPPVYDSYEDEPINFCSVL